MLDSKPLFLPETPIWTETRPGFLPRSDTPDCRSVYSAPTLGHADEPIGSSYPVQESLSRSAPARQRKPEAYAARTERYPEASLTYDAPKPDVYAEPTRDAYAEPTPKMYADPTANTYVNPTRIVYADQLSNAYADRMSNTYADPTPIVYADPRSDTYADSTLHDPSASTYADPVWNTYADPVWNTCAEPTSNMYADPSWSHGYSMGAPALLYYPMCHGHQGYVPHGSVAMPYDAPKYHGAGCRCPSCEW